MTLGAAFTAYWTIQRYEIHRLCRLWKQTLLPPVITTVLYFIIFGHVIGSRIGPVHGISYAAFIAPGLIMMQMIMGAYTASVFIFYFAKYTKSIEEILVSPMSSILVLMSYMSVGMLRGLVTGVIVMIIAMIFAQLPLHSIGIILFDTLFSTAIFSLCGVINGVFAKSFDDISIIPNFILTPLTYFGGVFYSVAMLPTVWQYLSHLNPIYYIVSLFRFGFLGIDHVMLFPGVMLLVGIFVVVFAVALWLFKRGAGLRP